LDCTILHIGDLFIAFQKHNKIATGVHAHNSQPQDYIIKKFFRKEKTEYMFVKIFLIHIFKRSNQPVKNSEITAEKVSIKNKSN